MGAGVRQKGLTLGGVVTQGLKQADLYQIVEDSRSNRMLITPILHALEVPVRAMILPLRDTVAAGKIRDAVRELLMPVLPEGSIWLQDSALYHATLYHASSHAVRGAPGVKPIHASAEVVAEEERSIRSVCDRTCPVSAVLDRVVVTATGVVVACWQVLPEGGEPALLRAALGAALPNAPPREAQMVKEPAMLHTTIARLLQPPPSQDIAAVAAADAAAAAAALAAAAGAGGGAGGRGAGSGAAAGRELRSVADGGAGAAGSSGGAAGGGGGVAAAGGRRRLLGEEAMTESSSGGSAAVTRIEDGLVVGAVELLSATLCGLRAQFGEVWFIEEQDLLALALNGRYVRHLAPLRCPAAAALRGPGGRGEAGAAG
ncbi:hypothetical protein TSOC_008567 [Tetrabaena socialis]|uniref:Uncharacterized protein n=1 Tax=Tetrabaena socialis TaxID=47790 RepID=A0A2J7ZY62_9CHLO|nr:hypothetical protein TSOC_008567 [Tetrabaena socialis]|eukprot:PNH05211.1 hypothetical protein TSOC_008567 [Tetrabaena socialis]